MVWCLLGYSRVQFFGTRNHLPLSPTFTLSTGAPQGSRNTGPLYASVSILRLSPLSHRFAPLYWCPTLRRLVLDRYHARLVQSRRRLSCFSLLVFCHCLHVTTYSHDFGLVWDWLLIWRRTCIARSARYRTAICVRLDTSMQSGPASWRNGARHLTALEKISCLQRLQKQALHVSCPNSSYRYSHQCANICTAWLPVQYRITFIL